MTNLVAWISVPLMMSVHTGDWMDEGYGVMFHPIPYTNYHQVSIVETNFYVVIPGTNAVGVPFTYEINMAQTLFTNRRDSPVPSAHPGLIGGSLPGSISIRRIQIPPIPK